MSDASARHDVAAALGAELAAQGFPRIPAAVIMALTLHPDGRMTAAELSAEVGVSAAAVSGAVRYLGTLGFVRSSTEPGSRRHVYSLPPVPWYAATLTQDRYGHIVEVLDRGVSELAAGPSRERLAEMAEFFRFLQSEMPRLWARWKGGSADAAPDDPGDARV